MICPHCEKDSMDFVGTTIIDSRAHNGGRSLRRRRKCLNCGKRFTTIKSVVSTTQRRVRGRTLVAPQFIESGSLIGCSFKF